MKKYFKILSLISLLIIISTLFSSCDALDEMRKNQAFWNNAEKTEIIYNNEIYKKMEISGKHLLDNYDYNNYSEFKVTEKDVPVLLSGILGETLYLQKDNEIITVNYGDYYCILKSYDEIVSKILNAKPSETCVYNDFEGSYELLSESDNEIVVEIITKEPQKIDYEDYRYYGAGCRCDAEMYIEGEYIEFVKADGKYYIGGSGGEYYEVPEKYREWFISICDKYFYY